MIRESAERTKLIIVFDVSAKTKNNAVSLNDCLETCPPHPNALYDILIRPYKRPIILCRDIDKAFCKLKLEKMREMPQDFTG